MLEKILDVAVKTGFVTKNIQKLKAEYLKLGPTGLLLTNNLKTEWFHNIVINKDVSVFLNNSDVNETYDFAKEICLEKLPFGIAEICKKKVPTAPNIVHYYEDEIKEKDINFESLFQHEDNELLKCTMFVSQTNSTQFFHQWQRERRMWWRKFSPAPGKYSLTDIKNEESLQSVEILAKYPWGTQIIEKIDLNTLDKNYSAQQLQFKEGKRLNQAHTITSQIDLLTLTLNTICDAYDESTFQDKTRTLLRFHRKLAPYKISFSVHAANATAVAELKDLALYLCRQLRTNHISTVLLPSSSKHTLETQYRQYDQLGIPYTVLLNDKTLVDGVCHLRSRDTTLKEQVHVAELVAYVEKLFKNY